MIFCVSLINNGFLWKALLRSKIRSKKNLRVWPMYVFAYDSRHANFQIFLDFTLDW